MMRLLVAALALVLAVGMAATFWWGHQSEVVPAAPDATSPKLVSVGADSPQGKQLPQGVVALRSEPPTIRPEGLADRPTACLLVIDYRTEKPLAGAVVRSMHNGADLAFSDERGFASVPLAKPTQLAVVLDAHLLRLAPAQLGTTEQDPQIVRLVPDRWSLTRQFTFVDSAGARVEDVFARLRPIGKASPVRSPMPTGDSTLRRAWTEHTMLATRAVSRDMAVQLGKYNADRVHHLVGDPSVIRFVVPGDYELEAVTTSGLVALVDVVVLPGSTPGAQAVVMRKGALVVGRVTDLAGAGLVDAEITVKGSDPLGLLATTARDGEFMIGPLANTPVTLLVRHGLYEPATHGPIAVSTGAREVSAFIKLRALDRRPLRGRVRAKPDFEPIARAKVIWQVPGGAAITATTASDGTFSMQAAGDAAASLIVQAPGYVTYRELVDPGAAFQEYDIWPAHIATRLAKGITATLEGVVFDRDGSPVVNASVRWMPDHRVGFVAFPSRRVLEGGSLQLPGVATTDTSGSFVIETNQFGSGRVILAGDASSAVPSMAIAGQTKNGLELRL